VVVLTVVSGVAYGLWMRERYLPQTVVGGVAIGGLTRAEAAAALEERVRQFRETPLTFRYASEQWELTPQALGTEVDTAQGLDAAWEEQRPALVQDRLTLLARALVVRSSYKLAVTPTTNDGTQVFRDTVLNTIESAHSEATLEVGASEVRTIAGVPGKRLVAGALREEFSRAFSERHSLVSLTLEDSDPEVTVAMAEPARLRASELMQHPLTLVLDSQRFSVTRSELAEWLRTEVARDGTGMATGLRLVVSGDLRKQLEAWAGSVNREPVNAKLAADGTSGVSITEPAVDGRTTDLTATIESVNAYLGSTKTDGMVQGVVAITPAPVRAATLAELGITQLVGTATTDFVGSPTNRAFNIALGAKRLDRQLVLAGGAFSTTGTLGSVELSDGYLAELVIKGNRTVPEAGGGLCQVSTTLFRAVLNAGLPILERQNHAYRVSYYERGTGPGLDATVYMPSPDLKWKNDLAQAVYVQSSVVGTKITFTLFGTRDGRVSTVSSPRILETYPVGEPIYANTDSLKIGETKQVERPHDGAKTAVDYTVMRDGKQIYSKTFTSIYRAWPAQYLVGTAAP
jgi:vancomycin resistance protein YoaR